MSQRFKPYNILMGLAVQGKRVLNGNIAQSRFTRYLESIERLPEEELSRLQAVELSRILKHAVKKTAFYKHLDGELELSADTAHEDIKSFPIVTKELLGSRKNEFRDPATPILNSMYSGGTTMTRVSVDIGRNFETHKADEYFNRVAGIYPGMPRFLLTRHEETYNENGPGEKDIAFKENRFSRTYYVSPYDFNEEKLKKAYDMFIRSKAHILKGNTAMLVEFAESIDKNGWDAPEVPIVFSGQNNMQPEYIETLKRVFGSKVFDAYGATEIGITAAQCEEGKGLHYIPVIHHIETLKDGEPVGFDKTGSLVITSLINYAMPIIRFQIGDYGTLASGRCTCGRTLPMLRSIDGRLYEVINTSKGAVVSVYEIKAVLNSLNKIVDFQVIQEKDETFMVSLVTHGVILTDDEEKYILDGMKRLLNSDIKVKIEYTEGLRKLPSGKILRILSKERYEQIAGEGN